MWWLHAPQPSGAQIGGVFLIIGALLVMSPLHHLPLYIRQIREAIAEKRLVMVDFVGNDPAVSPATARFITVNFQAVRDVLRKHSHGSRPS
jgi:hypothetical protein